MPSTLAPDAFRDAGLAAELCRALDCFGLDRLGLRLGTNVAVAIWTPASAPHAFVRGIVALAARTVLGFGAGATSPAGLRTVTQTLPVARRIAGGGAHTHSHHTDRAAVRMERDVLVHEIRRAGIAGLAAVRQEIRRAPEPRPAAD